MSGPAQVPGAAGAMDCDIDFALSAGVGVPVELPLPVAPSASDGELLNQVVGFYHHSLLESPEALAYLGKRCVGDPELVARFRLG